MASTTHLASTGCNAPDRPSASAANLLTGVELRSGEIAYIRAIRPEDAHHFREGLMRMSETSRYRRFMTGVSQLTEAEIEYFSNVDGVDHAAFGAEVRASDGEMIGIGTARYIRSSTVPDEADFAVTVVDDYQGKGVATALLNVLTAHARQNGIRRFTAEMLAENAAIRSLIQHRGGEVVLTDDASLVLGFLDLGVRHV